MTNSKSSKKQTTRSTNKLSTKQQLAQKTDSTVTQKPISWLEFLKINWYFLQDLKKPFVFWAIVLFSASFASLILPAIFGAMLNALTQANKELFLKLALLGGITNAIIAIIRLTGKEKAGIIRAKTNQNVKILGLQRLVKQSILWHQKQDVGTKITRIEQGAEAIEMFQRNLYQQYYNVLKGSIGVFTVFLFISPYLSIIAILYLIIFLLIQHYYNQKTIKLIDQIQHLKEATQGKFTEALSNILTVKAQSSKLAQQTVQKAQELLTQKKIELLKFKNSKWKIFQVFNSFTSVVVYTTLGLQVLATKLTVGSFTALANYFDNFRIVIGQATVYYDDLLKMRQQISRMMENFKDVTIYPGQFNWPIKFGHIRLNNLNFQLESFKLTNINLTIKHKEHIGLVGPSGSGKSTLVKILLGLYPLENKQQYLIKDLKSKKEISFFDIKASQRNQKLAVVLQDVELFNMSLKDNILLAKPFDSKLYKKVLKLSKVEEFISKLPEKDNTQIGEKGYKLSGGQRQRIGLARALYQQPEILILDEAFSNIQISMAQEILKDLKKQNLTIVQITHNPTLLKQANKIVHMKNGQITKIEK